MNIFLKNVSAKLSSRTQLFGQLKQKIFFVCFGFKNRV